MIGRLLLVVVLGLCVLLGVGGFVYATVVPYCPAGTEAPAHAPGPCEGRLNRCLPPVWSVAFGSDDCARTGRSRLWRSLPTALVAGAVPFVVAVRRRGAPHLDSDVPDERAG